MTEHPGTPAVDRPDSLGVVIWGGTHVHVQDHRDAVARHPRAHLVAEVPEDATPDLASQRVGAVILDGRTDLHRDQLRALPPGPAVFVEKPLGLTAAAARQVAAAVGDRTHSVGFFQHLLPATRRWVRTVHAAAEHGRPPARIELDFGHDGRVSGMFTGEHAWMVDPAQGGSGNFLDLGLHLVHLVRRLGLGPLEPVSCELEPAPDGLSDAGGTAVLRAGPTEVRLSVTARQTRPFRALAMGCARSGATEPTWEVRGGELFEDGERVLTGPGPDAALAVTAFLDAATGVVGDLSTTDAAEAAATQVDLEALLRLAAG